MLTSLSTPIQNTLVRTQEYEADIFGLNTARQPDGEAEAASRRREDIREQVRVLLRELGTRKVTGDGFSISWFPVKGRKSLDRKAAERAGIDLTPFDREGDPSERLTITLS